MLVTILFFNISLFNERDKKGTKFVVRNGIVGDCIDWVAEGVCDVGIVCFRTTAESEFKKEMQRKQLKYGNIYQEPMHIIIGSGHPLYYTDATEITPLPPTDRTGMI